MDYSLAKHHYEKRTTQDPSLVGRLFIVPTDLKSKANYLQHLHKVSSEGLELKVEDVTTFVNQSAITDTSAFDLQEVVL